MGLIFGFLVVLAAIGGLVYTLVIHREVPGVMEQRFGVLEPLPADVGAHRSRARVKKTERGAQNEGNVIRQRILEHATLLFAERGYDGVRRSELARELGIGKATLYRHFRCKQALFMDSVEHVAFTLLPKESGNGRERGTPPGRKDFCVHVRILVGPCTRRIRRTRLVRAPDLDGRLERNRQERVSRVDLLDWQ